MQCFCYGKYQQLVEMSVLPSRSPANAHMCRQLGRNQIASVPGTIGNLTALTSLYVSLNVVGLPIVALPAPLLACNPMLCSVTADMPMSLTPNTTTVKGNHLTALSKIQRDLEPVIDRSM